MKILILHYYIKDNKVRSRIYSRKVYRYIKLCPIIALEGLGTNAVRTDGVWTWSDSIADDYKKGEISLPIEFTRRVDRLIFPYPFWFAFKIYILRMNLIDKINDEIEESIK